MQVALRNWDLYVQGSVFDYDRFSVTKTVLDWTKETVYIVVDANFSGWPIIFKSLEKVAVVLQGTPDTIIGVSYAQPKALIASAISFETEEALVKSADKELNRAAASERA